MNSPVKLSELINSFLFNSPENTIRFDRQTGKIVTIEKSIMDAVEEDDEDSLTNAPDWQKEEIEMAGSITEDNGTRFIEAPDPFDFHEYRQMEKFISLLSDREKAEKLWKSIKGGGAFRNFKNTLNSLGIEDQWFQYIDKATKQFLIEWAEANHVKYLDDLTSIKSRS